MTDFGPNVGGFMDFITSVMAPPAPFNPTTSPYVPFAFDYASQLVNPNLVAVPAPVGINTNWTLLSLATYNLAADFLIQFAQDGPDDPIYKDDLKYWQWLRRQYRVLDFVPGVISSTSDSGTSSSFAVLPQLASMTLANLQNLKTPYGRAYLAIAGSWGSVWGLD